MWLHSQDRTSPEASELASSHRLFPGDNHAPCPKHKGWRVEIQLPRSLDEEPRHILEDENRGLEGGTFSTSPKSKYRSIRPTRPCFSRDSPNFPSYEEAIFALGSAPCSPWLHPPGTPPPTGLSPNFPSMARGWGRTSQPRCRKHSSALNCTAGLFPKNTSSTSLTIWFYQRQEKAQLKVKNKRTKKFEL